MHTHLVLPANRASRPCPLPLWTLFAVTPELVAGKVPVEGVCPLALGQTRVHWSFLEKPELEWLPSSLPWVGIDTSPPGGVLLSKLFW